VGAMLMANLTFGTFLALLKKGTGFDFWAYLLHTVMQTLPLTLGVAVISLLVGLWFFDDLCELGTLLLGSVGILCFSGYLGTFLTGGMEAFHASYAPYLEPLSGNGPLFLLLKALAYSLLSVVGFYTVYGPLNFFSSLVIGAAAPWATMYVLARKYEAAEQKLSAESEG
jgi:hypothetical protein